jgi:hypothetical protein
MSRKQHAEAILTRLREHPDLADRVFEGVAVRDDAGQSRTRYVTVWIGSPRRAVGRYNGPQDEERYRATIHSVSQLPSDAGDLADAVASQLVDWTPTIAGRTCRRLVADPEPNEMEYDSNLDPPLYWIPDTYELTSEPD